MPVPLSRTSTSICAVTGPGGNRYCRREAMAFSACRAALVGGVHAVGDQVQEHPHQVLGEALDRRPHPRDSDLTISMLNFGLLGPHAP